ncbi:MAG TPA: UdgX family uracil-DNA binding protein, partial [Myxococcaceae bacterium]|nr:UdgX family uracil-DNA binding protein [Myxococcaceae bacterium]
ASPRPSATAAGNVSVPRALVAQLEEASAHRDSERWNLYYRLLWRVGRGERHLLECAADPDVLKLTHQLQAVRRDVHKMHAFVRFRSVVNPEQGGEHFVAWYRPDHRVLRQAAPFFTRRFAPMHWSILTPEDSAHWNTRELQFGPGAPRSQAPDGDALEALWKTYYGHIFNPARLNVRMMRSEMPQRFWSTLPEAELIPTLVRQAPVRTRGMVAPPEDGSASSRFVPPDRNLDSLRGAARGCTACPLYARATQTVFGEGPPHAPLMIVGEQPGDLEDLEGRPFTGPAGRLLDRFLGEAGIDRREAYVTNAVKHFKWEASGKRRLHQRPGRAEVTACRGWLDAEIETVRPRLLLCLGVTAAQALLGTGFRLGVSRGHPFQTSTIPWGLATYHPSALLRADDRGRPGMEQHFREDLSQVAAALRAMSGASPSTVQAEGH